MNRKDFFKKMGIGIGATIAAPISSAFASFNDDKILSKEQKEFLSEYENWLSEFQQYVGARNTDIENSKNNQRLMELSAEAEKRKVKLELYMKDENFAQYFNAITQEITSKIA